MSAIVETKELEGLEVLRTHYYKANYEQIKGAFLEFIEARGFTVVSVNDDYNEIFTETLRMSVTAKIIEQTPKETSIDFYVTADYLLFSKKRAYSMIEEILAYIGKKYEFKGLSLHP